MDEYGPGEMAIPEWRLLQKVGGDWAKGLGGKAGQFFNKTTDELADELNIVVVDIMMGRAKWGTEISDAGPVCASMDAKTNFSIYNDDCLQCPDRLDTPWSVDATERRTKCCLNYSILGIDIDHDLMPIMLRAHGTSALASRQLITQLKMNRALRGEYYRALVNIKCQEKNTPFGTTYVIHPRIVQLITDESRAKELQIESNKLLGAPIPLPEGRPDEEAGPEPLGYTPTGTPFYSEEERDRLMAKEAAPVELSPQKTRAAEAPAKTPPAAEIPEPIKGEKKEPTEKAPLDLDF
ncbi:MAG: hypothetical protein Q7J06_00720 [Bacteroidales bacterium]|nr:hypothetical protein [Bacteroidales bacterium]